MKRARTYRKRARSQTRRRRASTRVNRKRSVCRSRTHRGGRGVPLRNEPNIEVYGNNYGSNNGASNVGNGNNGNYNNSFDIFAAIRSEDVDAVRDELERGAVDFAAANELMQTPIMVAVEVGTIPIIDMLLREDPDVAMTLASGDGNGHTAFDVLTTATYDATKKQTIRAKLDAAFAS
jgi:hypothetical protein